VAKWRQFGNIFRPGLGAAKALLKDRRAFLSSDFARHAQIQEIVAPEAVIAPQA
jgi:hypothetical protein